MAKKRRSRSCLLPNLVKKKHRRNLLNKTEHSIANCMQIANASESQLLLIIKALNEFEITELTINLEDSTVVGNSEDFVALAHSKSLLIYMKENNESLK